MGIFEIKILNMDVLSFSTKLSNLHIDDNLIDKVKS